MARSTTKAADTAPGDEVVARGADVPLALAALPGSQTRDALLDPREGDIIPEIESKGYHAGMVRQPAEAVLTAAGDVKFESDLPSKFEDAEGESFIDKMKAAHNESDNSGEPILASNLPEPTREEAIGAIVARDETGSTPDDVVDVAPAKKSDK